MIVYPTRPSLQVVGAVGILFVIWVTALLLAAPLFIWRSLQVHAVNLELLDISTVAYCIEEWPLQHGRALYSLFSLVVQYLLPIVTVSVAYSRICRKLHHRYSRSTRKEPRRKEDKRMRRTNALLVAIALIFCVSWLPLNVFNVVVDLHNPFTDNQNMLVAYAICHMIGMSSACSNPLLYGWLNDNFRKVGINAIFNNSINLILFFFI